MAYNVPNFTQGLPGGANRVVLRDWTQSASTVGANMDGIMWAPALCTTTIELDPEEPIPLDEDGFCSYLDQLDPLWQLLDLTDDE